MKPADIQTLRCILWPLSLEAQSKVTDQSLEFYVLLFLCTSFFVFWLRWLFVAVLGISLVGVMGGALLQCSGF